MRRTTFGNVLGQYPRVILGDTGLTNFYYWATRENPLQPWALDGEWMRITLPFGAAHVTGAPNRASLAAFSIQTFDVSTGPATVNFGGLATMSESATQWPHGVVSWTADDGFASQFSIAAPYMDRYGQRATSYIITETLWGSGFGAQYFSLAQARELELMNGWEMGVHSYTGYNHNVSYTGISDAQALADMQAGKFWLLNNGFRCPETFCYPEGMYNSATLNNCLSNFASSLSISQCGDDPGETWPPADRARIRRIMIGPATVTADIQGYIDKAVANHQWLVLGFHDLAASPTGLQSLTSQHFTLCDYIASSGAACLPVSEVLKAPVAPQPCGVLTAPSVPATTVAVQNPFATDVTIYITAGASTCAVKLNATTVFTIPSAGVNTVRLESMATITLTYTSAPTWVWFGD
jgi:peptidoglycan/xylan/chitin deacetylase (PgdA/CDA1 family)